MKPEEPTMPEQVEDVPPGCICPFPGEPGYVKRNCPVHDPDGTYHRHRDRANAAEDALSEPPTPDEGKLRVALSRQAAQALLNYMDGEELREYGMAPEPFREARFALRSALSEEGE